jgi:hypothetical protein
MAESLTIQIIRPPDVELDERASVEVDGAVQQDLVRLAGPGSRRRFGAGRLFGRGTFGISRGMTFGDGLFGAGYFGQGTDVVAHQTLATFVAGDYSVRIRRVDAIGNAGAWTSATNLKHRPTPAAPTNLSLDGSTLSWQWSNT